MNILYVTPAYKPAWRFGGPVRSVSAAAEALVKLGHKVTVFTTTCNLDEDLDVPTNCPTDVNGVTVWYFKRKEPLKMLFPFIPYLSRSVGVLYSPAMKKALNEMMPTFDVVNTQIPFNYPTYIAAKIALKCNKPLFYHQRGVLAPASLKFRSLKKKIYLKLIEIPILEKATRLIALTKAEEESYKLLVDTPVTVIPNAIILTENDSRHKISDFTAYGIKPHHKVILFLARVRPAKGADVLLSAFMKIQKQHKDAILVMAGPDEFGLEETFKKSVKKAGLKNRVVFPGMLMGEKKSEILARADLFCLPSTSEGFSMAILEALASQTAVLISPNCNFPEVMTAQAGVICEKEITPLAAALNKMLNDPDELVEMGKRGCDLVAKNYTWDTITKSLEKVYKESLKSS